MSVVSYRRLDYWMIALSRYLRTFNPSGSSAESEQYIEYLNQQFGMNSFGSTLETAADIQEFLVADLG